MPASTQTQQPDIAGSPSQRAGASREFLTRLLRRGPVLRLELAGLLLLCVAVVASVVWVSASPLLLGHDESVYAVLARHWQAGTPDTGVADHRAPLLSALGVPLLALGGGEQALRMWGLVALIASGVAVWWLARTLGGPAAGLIAATVFMLAPTVLEAGTLYLTDLPAAGVLLALAGLLWSQFGVHERPNGWLLLAAPLAWAAYEFRYGSALIVVLLFLTVGVMFWPTVRAHARLVGVTLAVLVALLIPHLVNSTLDVGTPWGRLLYLSRLVRPEYPAQGLLEYLRWFPRDLAGVLAAALMAVGLIGGLVVVLRGRGASRRERYERRGVIFVAVPALAHVVMIGVASPAEPRFVFFSIGLLCAAGAVVVARVLHGIAARSQPLAWVALIAFALVMGMHTALLTRSEARSRDLRDEVLLTSANALRQDAGFNCSVLTSYSPQVTWYSGCASYSFGSPPVADRQQYLTDDAWLLLFEPGKRQPEGALLEGYLRDATPVASWSTPDAGGFNGATLYRLEPEES